MAKFDIITIGSATRDVFLESQDFKDVKSSEFSGGVGECLSLGSKNEVRKIFLSTGGGATNAAVTFARLGFKTAVLARVGNDGAANEIVKVLDKEGVEIKFIQRDEKDNTAYSTLLMHGPGERTVLVYRGPSERLSLAALRTLRSPDALVGAKEGGLTRTIKTKWFYVTSLGDRPDLVRKIWAFARKNKVKIAWNPGREELKLGFSKLLPFIKQCEVFNVNREEARQLLEAKFGQSETSTKMLVEAKQRPKEASLRQILKNLCNTARIVLITDGKRGAYACRTSVILSPPKADEESQKQTKLEKFFVSSLGTKPRNTTGAGDAFGSGFIAGLLFAENQSSSRGAKRRGDLTPLSAIDFALRLATLNADSVIRKMGAKSGILKRLPSKESLNRVKVSLLKNVK